MVIELSKNDTVTCFLTVERLPFGGGREWCNVRYCYSKLDNLMLVKLVFQYFALKIDFLNEK